MLPFLMYTELRATTTHLWNWFLLWFFWVWVGFLFLFVCFLREKASSIIYPNYCWAFYLPCLHVFLLMSFQSMWPIYSLTHSPEWPKWYFDFSRVGNKRELLTMILNLWLFWDTLLGAWFLDLFFLMLVDWQCLPHTAKVMMVPGCWFWLVE